MEERVDRSGSRGSKSNRIDSGSRDSSGSGGRRNKIKSGSGAVRLK